ncbi:lysosome membrane protein 2-like [Rhincodon typus]|uniref:lysosome membrane protein 2-like n=1 Tax=Rhincodon typus TaxID=259920 RepID=UPI002030E72C|nr:lysosome membrane protein 2-like [Rhincodon typus]
MTHVRNKAALTGVFALCCFVIFLVLFLQGVFRKIVENRIKEHTELKLNSEVYKNWKDPPVPAYLQFYFFNVENKQEILQGGRATVRQLGPYTYKEFRHRANVSLFSNSTISASTRRSFVFEPTMSVGDPRKDIVTTINIPFATLLQMLKRSGITQKILAAALFTLKRNALFQSRTVEEWLWGYEHPLLKFGHKVLPSVFPGSQFGLFYGINGTDDGEYLFNTGKDDYMKFTEVMMWNGQE